MTGRDRAKCHRCGDVAETHDWERSSTFWGWFGLGTVTHTIRRVRIKSQYFRREGSGSPLLVSDDIQPLCLECWGELVGEFMQGRAVPALADRRPIEPDRESPGR